VNVRRLLPPILAPPAAIVLAIALYNSMRSERAALTITHIGFEPFPLVANHRELVVISFKNTGHNYATIEAVAIDRVKCKLPEDPVYDPAYVAPASIAGGEEQELISDVGSQPLTFTQAEIDSLNASKTQFKIVGFIKYVDQHPWILGRGVVQFC
jgi:hypothetical protein